LQSVGLGNVVTWAYAALIFGIGYMIKDPARDLISYFIILMQRPIKIGDYIRIDDKTMGVVRKITPKSVILRRKNSITLIVPNTDVITNSVYNWNYTRSFVAFDDIAITIPYKHDPVLVRSLLMGVVDEHALVLKSPKPIVRLDRFGEYGYKFLIRGFVSSTNALEIWHIAGDIRIAIISKLHEENISIAVPVRMIVHQTDASQEQWHSEPDTKEE